DRPKIFKRSRSQPNLSWLRIKRQTRRSANAYVSHLYLSLLSPNIGDNGASAEMPGHRGELGVVGALLGLRLRGRRCWGGRHRFLRVLVWPLPESLGGDLRRAARRRDVHIRR